MDTPLDENVKKDEPLAKQETSLEEEPLRLESAEENESTDSDLLIEEDGDFFWVIQKVIWSIAKTLIILGIMMILIWAVWDKNPFGGEEVPPEGTKKEVLEVPAEPINVVKVPQIEKPVQVQTPTKISSGLRQDLTLVADIAAYASAQSPSYSENILERSIIWLNEARILGEFSPEDLALLPLAQRAGRLEAVIGQADLLFQSSFQIRGQLKSELNFHLAQAAQASQEAQNAETQINQNIKAFDSREVTTLLSVKKEAQSREVVHRSEAKIRELLGQNVTNFDRLLRQKTLPILVPSTSLRATPK